MGIVLLYDSHLKLLPGKLKSRWRRPITVKEVFPYSEVEIEDDLVYSWKVNGHRLNQYIGGTG